MHVAISEKTDTKTSIKIKLFWLSRYYLMYYAVLKYGNTCASADEY